MKKLRVLFLVISVLFVSCSQDDTSEDIPEVESNKPEITDKPEVEPNKPETTDISESILGEWVIIDVNYTGEQKVTYDGETVITEFTGQGKNYRCKVNFKEDPKIVVSTGTYDVDLVYNRNGELVRETKEFVSFESVGDWRREENFIYVKNKGTQYDDKLEIKELTASRLVLEGSVKRDLLEDGQVITTIDIKYTFVR